jgi:putative SOS response-associated peptidase YedK
MCGRFSLNTDMEDLQEAFPGIDFGLYLNPSYNIAPSQNVLTIAGSNPDKAALYHWGLVPPWSKDQKIGYKMINARSETLAEKPSFKRPYKKQRCLIPASGFFEWKKENESKIPMHIHLKSGKPFAFAGLWEVWGGNKELPLYSCTIITTEANELLKEVHHRMPVILKQGDYEVWLDSKVEDTDRLNDLLKPFSADEMDYFPVSKFVNSPANNTPECIKPA